MSRLRDHIDWFEIWMDDKRGMIETMVRNMTADLDAGYNYFGNSISRQREEIERYKNQMDSELDKFKDMDETAVNRWCYYDLLKRGAIA